MKNESLISEDIQGVDREGTNSSISNGTLLTVDEVAKILRLQPETIRSMARRGDLPAIKLGRVWRFRSSSITQLLED
jgi:excisionase family DNA binding protein